MIDAFKKLHPRDEIKNLVMFVVWLGSIWTTIILLSARPVQPFNVQICFWLWFTCLFANFAEAMAEGRGKAHADALAQDAHQNHGPQAGRTERKSQIAGLRI